MYFVCYGLSISHKDCYLWLTRTNFYLRYFYTCSKYSFFCFVVLASRILVLIDRLFSSEVVDLSLVKQLLQVLLLSLKKLSNKKQNLYSFPIWKYKNVLKVQLVKVRMWGCLKRNLLVTLRTENELFEQYSAWWLRFT